MTPFALRIVTYLLAAGLILAAFFLWLAKRDAAEADRSSVEQNQRTSAAATGIAGDGRDAREIIYRTEVLVRDSRENYMREYEDAILDESVAGWADAPVPQRLRDLARERRERRERSGDPGDGSRSDPGTP